MWGPFYLTVAAVCMLVMAMGTFRLRRHLGWVALFAGMLCFFAGDVGYYGAHTVFPAWSDGFYMLMYLPMAYGLRKINKNPGDRNTIRDTILIFGALAVLTYAVEGEYIGGSTRPLWQQAIPAFYLLGDTMIFVAMLWRITMIKKKLFSTWALIIGSVSLIAADTIYRIVELHGGYNPPGPIDPGWLTFYIAWAAAFIHPSARQVSDA